MARRRLGPWFAFAVALLKPPMVVFTHRDWRGADQLPAEGGFVVAVNHVSHLDPIAVAHFLNDFGCPPRFLAKDSLFRAFFVGTVLRGAKQIPVYRETRIASDATRDAVAAVRADGCVVIYPEGTITRDPGLWPMTGKTGAARIALTTRCPVVPMGVWGPQDILAPYSKCFRLFPRKTMRVLVGPPVQLADLYDAEPTVQVLRMATERIMVAITDQVAQLRGEQPPDERFDARAAGLRSIGDPHPGANRSVQ